MRKFAIWVFIFAIVVGAFYMVFRPSDDFHGLLEYEAQNRAFARTSLQESINQTDDPDRKQFLEAYLNLEKLNQRKYAPMLEKYGVAPDANAFTRVRIWGGVLGTRLMPEISIKMIRDAAIRYVPKLKRLKSLAKEDREFFSYVVAQEQVQVDALTLAADGNYVEGAAALQSFADRNSKSE